MKPWHDAATAKKRRHRRGLGRMVAAIGLPMLCAGALAQAPVEALKAYGADPTQTSVSGLSSGAYMAVQLQVAYSRDIIGAGVIAGGPYYCAGNLYRTWLPIDKLEHCMGKSPSLQEDADRASQALRSLAAQGLIDDVVHLADRRIYVFHGSQDQVVLEPATRATVSFFQQAGVRHLKYENRLDAGHAVISPGQGNDCPENASPYISHCQLDDTGQQYDQAGELLKHIYEVPDKAALNPPGTASSGRIVAFDQRPYASGASNMADTGYLYVPQACAEAGSNCKVHVALHGCLQSDESLQQTQRPERFHRDAGYNRWAETNRLLVLYPQVNRSAFWWPNNPNGCWDWWGYSGYWWSNDYAYKSAPQMKAIMRMVNRLTQPRDRQ